MRFRAGSARARSPCRKRSRVWRRSGASTSTVWRRRGQLYLGGLLFWHRAGRNVLGLPGSGSGGGGLGRGGVRFVAPGGSTVSASTLWGPLACGITALLLNRFALPQTSRDIMIVSSIMPLVPGVIFTTAVRDTLNGDYSSGAARMLEAAVVALAVAAGVGASMALFRYLTGGGAAW